MNNVGKITDSERKRVLDERRWRAVAPPRLRNALRSGSHRRVELDKLYDEFCRNKSVDL